MILEILIFVFVFGMYLKLLSDFKNKKISFRRFFFWIFIWFALSLIVFFPQIVFLLAGLLGIERAKDLPIYVSIIILFYIAFKVGVKIEKIDKEITKIVRSVAIFEIKKDVKGK